MAAPTFASTGDLAEKKITFAEIGRDLYAFTAEGDPNSGVIIGDDGLARAVRFVRKLDRKEPRR